MASPVHPLIQTARGALTDEDYGDVESILTLAVEAAKDLEAENERLRDALKPFAFFGRAATELPQAYDEARAVLGLPALQGAVDEKGEAHG